MCFREPRSAAILGFSRAADIIGQLGEELAFVAPDQDTGLLPINRFVMDLEELAETDTPPPLSSGLHVARAWLDQTLDGSGKFTEETIRNFNQWHGWMTAVLQAWQTGTTMPAWPEDWALAGRAEKIATETRHNPPQRPLAWKSDRSAYNLPEDFGLLRQFHGEFLELSMTSTRAFLRWRTILPMRSL